MDWGRGQVGSREESRIEEGILEGDSEKNIKISQKERATCPFHTVIPVRYHSGESMKLNACILLLAHMVYL
jgi:hypothetical protein